MKSNERKIARQRLDRRFRSMAAGDLYARPPKGWIKAVREALGMTTAQLGRRVGVSQPQVVKMEQSEARKAITLDTLERAAQALGCDLVYALVPKEPLEDIVEGRAKSLARRQLEQTRHSMALETQSVSGEDIASLLEQLTGKVLENAGSNLWETI